MVLKRMEGLKHMTATLIMSCRYLQSLTNHTAKLTHCWSLAPSSTLPKSPVPICIEMATSLITDEAELGSLADFFDKKISAIEWLNSSHESCVHCCHERLGDGWCRILNTLSTLLDTVGLWANNSLDQQLLALIYVHPAFGPTPT